VLTPLFLAAAVALAAPVDKSSVRVLVLDFKPSGGVEANVVENITGLSAAILSEDERLEVLAGPDLRQMINLQIQKGEAGCDVDTASCIAELAGALDANYVVIGNVGYLGRTLNLNIVLFDQASGKNAGRRAVQAKDLSELSDALRAPLHGLVAGALGTAAPERPAAPGPSAGLVMLVGGAAGAVIGGALLAVSAFPGIAIADEEQKFSSGDQAAFARAVEVQTTWFDSGLQPALLVGGAVLLLAGGGAVAAGLAMGIE
jgi:hypothetical protein